MIDGLPVTTLARAVVDIARTAEFAAAVAVADAALRLEARRCRELGRGVGPASAGFVSVAPGHAELDAALRRAAGWPGVPDARRVVAFADGRAESVGESRSRVAMALAGLPPPALQWPVPRGGATAYTDFAWPERRTVGEFDGKVKYGRLLRPGQSPGDVVYAEKLREDAIRAEDWEVVRWTWADLRDFTDTAARIRGASAPDRPHTGTGPGTQGRPCARDPAGGCGATRRARRAWRSPARARGSSAPSRRGSGPSARSGCRR